MIYPATIGIVGGGQLGKMLVLAAKKMGFMVIVTDPTPQSPAGQVADRELTGDYKDEKVTRKLAKLSDVITIDAEFVNDKVLSSIEKSGKPVHPSSKTISIIKDKLKIVARKDIDVGEEITIDYAMMESSDYSFKCNCGFLKCRGVVTGNDWKIPELQNRYSGYFSGYLQEKIDKFH